MLCDMCNNDITIIVRCISEGTIVDNGQLICLYLIARLLQRELDKCLRLVTFLPMQDMDKHFGEIFSVNFNKVLLLLQEIPCSVQSTV